MQSNFNAKKYWDNRLSENFNLIGVGDISLTMSYNKWSYKVTEFILNKLFKKYITKSTVSALDIGSGTGFVVGILERFDKNITGIDISETAIKNLCQNYPNHKFYEIDAGSELLPFKENEFQLVTASSVLYHLTQDEALNNLLTNVHRVLSPDGFFIFSDNFIHNNNYNITHQVCRSLFSYEELLMQNGFEIVSRVPNYVLFNDPVDSRNKFYPRIWNLLTSFSKKWPWFDLIIWPCLYPIELILTSVLKESPAQEIMVCKALK
jgi:SAM-dependent methyltransferase